MSGLTRLEAARLALRYLGMRGKREQAMVLLSLIEVDGVFTVPGLARSCGVCFDVVYHVVSVFRRLSVVVVAERPAEPSEWAGVYGREVLAKLRREAYITGAAPHRLDLDRLRMLVAEGCSECDLGVLWEASG